MHVAEDADGRQASALAGHENIPLTACTCAIAKLLRRLRAAQYTRVVTWDRVAGILKL
jgi:hypothetical protein